MEETLARIAANVLGQERVGALDNLFDLGLDSILGIQIASRARQEGLSFTPAELFENPTISGLARVSVPVPDVTADAPLASHELADLRRELSGRHDVEDAYPVSPIQHGMLFHSALQPDSGAYIQQVVCDVEGRLELDSFAQAWRQVLARHSVLRTSFHWLDADRPVQVVLRDVDLPLQVFDWRDAEPDQQRERLEAYLRDDRRKGFVASWAPLLRLAVARRREDAHWLVSSYHHAIIDGWSLPVLWNDVLESYESLVKRHPQELPPEVPFRRYIDWLSQQDLAGAELFWRRELRGLRGPTPLGVVQSRTEHDGRGSFHEEALVTVDPDVSAALRTLAREQRLTLNTVVQGAWALLLSRYSGRSDVVFGTTVSGRPPDLQGAETMVGLFLNTLPFRVQVDEDAALAPWLHVLQQRHAEIRRFEFSPLIQVHDWSEIPRGQPLFESILVFENYPLDEALRARAGSLGVRSIRVVQQTHYPLSLFVTPGQEWTISAVYDPRRFDRATVRRLLEHLTNLLAGMADEPTSRLADLPMLTETEHSLLLREWGEAHGDHPRARAAGTAAAFAGWERLSEPEIDALLHHYLARGGADDE